MLQGLGHTWNWWHPRGSEERLQPRSHRKVEEQQCNLQGHRMQALHWMTSLDDVIAGSCKGRSPSNDAQASPHQTGPTNACCSFGVKSLSMGSLSQPSPAVRPLTSFLRQELLSEQL